MPTIHINTWPLSATLFNGEVAGGVVPVLFATDEAAALDSITSDLAKAHWDVNKVFFISESINLKEALALIKKPRYKIKKFIRLRTKLKHKNF